jgi:hypothetical protein
MLKVINKKILKDRFWRDVRRNAPNEIISAKPGAVAKWIFPTFIASAFLLFSVVFFIHHLETVTANGVITGTNTAGDIIWVEADMQEGNKGKIVPGQSVQVRFTGSPAEIPGMVPGLLEQATPTPVYNRTSVRILLKNGLPANLRKSSRHKKGTKVELLIIIKDMRLLQHILHRSSQSVKPQ